MPRRSTYPVSIATSDGACRLHCDRCGTTRLLLLTERAIEQEVPVFLAEHPEHCNDG